MKSQPHKVYDWFTTDDGRQIYRRVEYERRCARSEFPMPMIISDRIEPVQSMADGKTYDSMAALRRTYRADGNPQGVEYTEVGDAERSGPETPKVTKEECAVLLDKFEAAVNRGEIK